MTGADFLAHRRRLGWNQTEAASALGLTKMQISHIENGRTAVPGPAAILIALYAFGEWPGDLPAIVAAGRDARRRS